MTDPGADSDSDSDCGLLAFTKCDMSGVDFDVARDDGAAPTSSLVLDALDKGIAFGNYGVPLEHPDISPEFAVLMQQLAEGKYADALRGAAAQALFGKLPIAPSGEDQSVAKMLQRRVTESSDSAVKYLETELLGIAALNLFLQANYTGPSLSDEEHCAALADINPHCCFAESLSASAAHDGEDNKEGKATAPKRSRKFHGAVLSELVVEGQWPCQVCMHPYFLLLARSILLPLADPTRLDWTHSYSGADSRRTMSSAGTKSLPIYQHSKRFLSARLWCARAAVAHERLLQSRLPSETLFQEVDALYRASILSLCAESCSPSPIAATVWLEYGLAEHHFDRPDKGKGHFNKAKESSGLEINVTGALGKRTKYQQSATAQYVVKATSTYTDSPILPSGSNQNSDIVKNQLVEHSEEEILLERIKFEDDKENQTSALTVLDQSILLAFCLDVKNTNPSDGLTAEEMDAYLARVLDHHNNWMIYSTGLLERSWLEFERSHARERAILQMQALADQHTQRLTLTQSTRESIEESAPVQDRLSMIHCLVYPTRWSMIHDLADRYASLGVVTSAAELFADIEMWDEVVECYRRAGKTNLAEKIVRERLAVQETPRMLSALGDLTGDPSYYKKAIELSKGRYYQAYVALAAYYFETQDLSEASKNYEAALKMRPLQPFVWFRLGTISMQLERWELALKAFSEVVQQEPEEGEAWANVAAIHLRNKHPAEAYPALVEALRYNRKNWRIWLSKLYTCLDLEKYDEAVQACNMLLDIQATNEGIDGVPFVEAKCVRALVGGSLAQLRNTVNDSVAAESSRRTISRVYELLCRISSTLGSDNAWIFETLAYFHEQMGQDDKVLDYLMREYRSLTSCQGWEKHDHSLRKVCGVVSHISHLYLDMNEKESLTKAKFLLRGVVQTIKTARPDDPTIAKEVQSLEQKLVEIESALTELVK